ncbi:MAG: anaerobic sulfatase maturase [Candidatus Latescibacterota bacterium]
MPAAPAPHPVPAACHCMAKPTGSVCNLDCRYCFYLEKGKLYPERGSAWRMDEGTLERYVRQYIEAQDVPEVSFAWQGGEPTLMGIDFFRRAVALQQRYAGGKTISNAFQTNGILIDDEWAAFLAERRFLVGLSLDGPPELHDRYRVDRGGQPTFARVLAGLQCLRRHGVAFNTLTVVQHHNAEYPVEVYRFLRAEASPFMQFIPVVERSTSQPQADGLSLVEPGFAGQAQVTRWSVTPAQYGRFLCRLFDEWVRQDVGRAFVQPFDVALGAWMGRDSSLCTFAETCGRALVIEHNGDVYACDHFVYPGYRLGSIHEGTLREMVDSPQQRRFGQDKRDALPRLCRRCPYRFACHGGCPKHRFARTPEGERGLNYLCKAYRAFFAHVDPHMRFMAAQVGADRPAALVMDWVRGRQQARAAAQGRPGRNDPCPCGSGVKFKQCCARAAQGTAAT